MTLIISKIIDNKIYIESDSKITGDRIVRNNPIDSKHCKLKALILDPKLCLCYAGDIYFAEQAYKFFIKESKNKLDWNLYRNYLLQLNIESENSTHFIMAGYNNSNLPLLFEIKDRKISQVQQSWIGDKESFSYFQKYFLAELNENVKPKFAISNAFRKTLKNEFSDVVGGF